MTQQNNTPAQQHVIASPNPTIDDSKTPSEDELKRVESTPLPAASVTRAAPLKTTKPKPKRKRTRPRS